jgi:hypothetical protein
MKFGYNRKPNSKVNLTHLYVISLKNMLGIIVSTLMSFNLPTTSSAPQIANLTNVYKLLVHF